MTSRLFYGHVLIVEDEASLSILLREQLKKSGFDASQAYNLVEARNLLSRKRFEFVLLDIRLEDGNSEPLIGEIKSSAASKNQGTHLYLMSSNLTPEIISRSQGLVEGYFSKPLVFDRLVAEMRRTLLAPQAAKPTLAKAAVATLNAVKTKWASGHGRKVA